MFLGELVVNFVEIMANVLSTEANALLNAAKHLEEEQADKLIQVYKELLGAGGSLFFCGVGKSGLVGRKLAATFSSLGLPSHFLHPTEALHGDLGTVREHDAVVFISYSGTSEEILKLMPFLPVTQKRRIALVGKPESPIGKSCDLVFNCFVEREACLNDQAPTTSSTITMAIGDAMAVLYEHYVGITKEGFAQFHPGGRLGKSLRLKVTDLLIPKEKCAITRKGQTLKDAIMAMTQFPVGAAIHLNANDEVEGILVEGDIRRLLSVDQLDMKVPIENIINTHPTLIDAGELAITGLEMMEKRSKPISLLPVIEQKKFIGILRLHDLFKEGL